MARAALKPDAIDYIEAHGTGTPLGDPIEFDALEAALGGEDMPRCLLGSVKSNIGHLEASAGIAGFIKVVLALQHERIPRHLHFRQLNPMIELAKSRFAIAEQTAPWPRTERPRIAGVSSFGFSGTNAHVLLQEAPERPAGASERAHLSHQVIALSGRSSATLRRRAEQLSNHLEAQDLAAASSDFADLAHTLGARQSHYEHRLAIVAKDSENLNKSLLAYLERGSAPACISGPDGGVSTPPRVALLFTGQGSQYVGMGRQLYEQHPVFAAALDRCAALFSDRLEWPLKRVMFDAELGRKHLHDTTYTQPALFSLGYALHQLLVSLNVSPVAVLGHSIGEVGAACAAGVLSLEDAVKLVSERASRMGALPGGGAMLSLALDESHTKALLQQADISVDVAAFNSPQQTVVSGASEAIQELAKAARAQGIEHRLLEVSHAFHSQKMDPMLASFEASLAGITWSRPNCLLVSNVTGAVAGDEVTTASYWAQHVRSPVRFRDGIQTLLDQQVDALIEIGPQPVLLGLARACKEAKTVALPCLRKGRDDIQVFSRTLASLYAEGTELDFNALLKPFGTRKLVSLPRYPFDKKRYWIDETARRPKTRSFVLAGRRLADDGGALHHVVPVGCDNMPWLADHRLFDRIILSGPHHVGAVMSVALARLGEQALTLRDIQFLEPLELADEHDQRELHVLLLPEEAGGYRFETWTIAEAGHDWTLHCRGRLTGGAQFALAATPQQLATQHPEEQSAVALMQRLTDANLLASERWHISEVRSGNGGLARIEPGPALLANTPLCPIDPVLLEAAGWGVHAADLGDELFVHFAIEQLRYRPAPTDGAVWARSPESHAKDDRRTFDLSLCDAQGTPFVEIERFTIRRMDAANSAQPASKRLCRWLAQEDALPLPQGDYRLVHGDGGTLDSLQLVAQEPITELAAGEVRIAVAAAAMSFRDVLTALNMLAVEATPLGTECVGEVVAVGAEVENLRVGDRVMAVVHGSFSSAVVCDARWVHPIAADMSFAQAATLPISYLTAWMGLKTIANLQPRQRVLIHAAAGGVGMAAVKLAQRVGAEIFATASPPKWEQLRALGIEHIMNSRNDEFAGQIREITGGEGVDVVLNALTGDLINAGLSCLRDGGHFLEMGKADIRSEEWLTQHASNVKYRAYDLGDADPDDIQRMLASVADTVARGELPTLPYRSWSIQHAKTAFRFMAQARHVGKIVLLAADAQGSAVGLPPDARIAVVDPGGNYLHRVSGWLRSRGVRQFVLTSDASAVAAKAAVSLRARGADVEIGQVEGRIDGAVVVFAADAPSSLAADAWALHQQLAERQLSFFNVLLPEAIDPKLDKFARMLVAHRNKHQQIATIDASVWPLVADSPPSLNIASSLPNAAPTQSECSAASAVARKLGSLALSDRASHLMMQLREVAAKTLGAGDPSEVPSDRPLQELGFDSLMSVEYRNAVKQQLGVELPSTLVFDYPTLQAQNDFILHEVLQLAETTLARQESARTAAGPNVDEPIAIVAMGCRLPGDVNEPEQLWQLVRDGRDAIREVPAERWDIDAFYDSNPDADGKMTTRWGGFLSGVDKFDAGYFSITPREAVHMDPQQRLLLEVTSETLERAGVPNTQLMDSRTGVFVGICGADYQGFAVEHGLLTAYTSTGNAHSVASGRLSYWLGARGPAIVVDTACSSSLVTVHLACQALRNGECDMALAGGVNLILRPEWSIHLSRLKALSPTGRCRTFAASADGYVRSEGCGMVMLQRLSDAQRLGRPILAVIRGSAVNQDGRSNGLTAPNGPSQQDVIQSALAQAGVQPAEIDFVETHGTGTSLGDPIEVQALASALGADRPAERPLVLSALKTNIGHTEGAAGVAGLIKAVLSLQHEAISPVLHMDEPNPHIPWSSLPVEVATTLRPWPRSQRPRFAGVSSFGFSGTNAHVVLQEAPAPVRAEATDALLSRQLVVLSGRNKATLLRRVEQLDEQLREQPELAKTPSALADLAHTLAAHRNHFDHRLAIVCDSGESLQASVEDYLTRGRAAAVIDREDVASRVTRVAFLFTGQGAQYVGMGRQLFNEQPVFREAFEHCVSLFDARLGQSLKHIIFETEGDKNPLDDTRFTQPALFTLGYALDRLLRHLGIEPVALMGHSIGEVTAACAAGLLSLEDAVLLVAERSARMGDLPRGGAMLSLAADEQRCEQLLLESGIALDVAAYNSPRQTVVSGALDAIERLEQVATKAAIQSRRLSVSHAFHSKQMDPMLAGFEQALSGIRWLEPTRLLLSNVTGKVAGEEVATPSYWAEHVRSPVRFQQGLASLLEQKIDALIELGPQPVLLGLARANGVAAPLALPSLRKGRHDIEVLNRTLASLYTSRANLDLEKLQPAPAARKLVSYPCYPFERRRYWIEDLVDASARGASTGIKPSRAAISHVDDESALGLAEEPQPVNPTEAQPAATPAVSNAVVVAKDIVVGRERMPWLGDHLLYGQLVVSGPHHLCAALTVAQRELPASAFTLRRVQFLEPLALASVTAEAELRVMLEPIAANRYRVSSWTLDEAETHWRKHMDGELTVDAPNEQQQQDLQQLSQRCPLPRNAQAVMASLQSAELMSDEYWAIQSAQAGNSETLAEVVKRPTHSTPDFAALDPVLLEACSWTVRLDERADFAYDDEAPIFIPFFVESLSWQCTPGARVWASGSSRRDKSDETLTFDLDMLDAAGVAAVRIQGFTVKASPRAAVERSRLPARLHRWFPNASLSLEHIAVLDEGHRAHAALGMLLAAGAKQLTWLCADPESVEVKRIAARLRRRGANLIVAPLDAGKTGAEHLIWLVDASASRRGIKAAWTWHEAHRQAGQLVVLRFADAAAPIGKFVDEFVARRREHAAVTVDDEGFTQAPTHPPRLQQNKQTTTEDTPFVVSLRAAPKAQRNAMLRRALREQAANVIGAEELDAVPAHQPLQELGFDSLMSVEFRNAAQLLVGVELPATVVFDYPTIDALVQLLLEQTLQLDKAPAVIAEPQPVVPAEAPRATVAKDDRIAIIGVGCRYPGGANDADSLWRLVESGTDAISEVPADRWDVDAFYDPDPAVVGKMITRWGGFIEDVDLFDAAFFGVSPREAVHMDPQQRLLLEVGHQALEHAGIDPQKLMGAPVGVFLGMCSSDYQTFSVEPATQNAYTGTGNAHSVAAGRLSYTLGLRGPSIAVDTACSSSLVALHLASQSLRSGECDMALCGGVNLILTPDGSVYFSRVRAMSPSGRCQSFAAAADGYVRSEGCGMVVLKRLADAQRDGDSIIALVRGSALNQDGRSNGMTAPNGPAQSDVITRALRDAKLQPSAIDYVEAHGTGTPLGDPIEVRAAAAVLGSGRSDDQPLVLSSIKTNIGHTEGAAGVAGIIKAALCLQHEAIAPSLHFDAPNPHIPWAQLPVEVATELRPWPRSQRGRFAGVSSFGFSGTNAHIILEEAPATAPTRTTEASWAAQLLPLSARSEAALRQRVEQLVERLEQQPELAESPATFADLIHSHGVRRSHFEHRLAFLAKDRQSLSETLTSYLERGRGSGIIGGNSADGVAPKVAFLFTGQGSQYVGMGRELYQQHPVFRASVDLCAKQFDGHLSQPLKRVMFEAELGERHLNDTTFTQPALFTLGYALNRLLRSWGIEPVVLMGHSIGEVTAACCSGLMSLEDAVMLVAERAKRMGGLPSGGAMLSVALDEEQTHRLLEKSGIEVDAAAFNSSLQTVLSGDEQAITALAQAATEAGVEHRRLTVSHAFHSKRMVPMLAGFEQALTAIRWQSPEHLLISNVSGAVGGAEMASASYWADHVRSPVRFQQGLAKLLDQDVDLLLELGPQPVLLGLARASGAKLASVPLLRRGRKDSDTVMRALATLYAHGSEIDFTALHAPFGSRNSVALPTYPFDRQRYWIDRAQQGSANQSHWTVPGGSALAGAMLTLPSRHHQRVLTVGISQQRYLGDHVVHGTVVVPAAFHVSVMLAVGVELLGTQRISLTDVQLLRPLILSGDCELFITVDEALGGKRAFRLASRVNDAFTVHASGFLQSASEVDVPAPATLEAAHQRCVKPFDIEQFYAQLAALRIDWGPRWRRLDTLRSGELETVASLRKESTDLDSGPLHPATLDNVFGTVLPLMPSDLAAGDTPYLPYAIGAVHLYTPAPVTACHARGRSGAATNEAFVSDMVLYAEDGFAVAKIEGLVAKRAPQSIFLELGGKAKRAPLLVPQWQPIALPEAVVDKRILVLCVDGDPLPEQLRNAGVSVDSLLFSQQDTLLARAAEADVILCAYRAGPGDVPEAVETLVSSALRTLQRLIEARVTVRLVWLTRGAHMSVAHSNASESDATLAAATLWGLGRVWLQEHAELRGSLIDIEADSPDAINALALAVSQDNDEPQLIWREGWHALRLVEPEVPATPMEWRLDERPIVISGGLGALGLHVARWLLQQHDVAKVVLLSRSGANTDARREAVQALSEFGKAVEVATLDVTDQAAVAQAIAQIAPQGVVHAAGILDDGVITKQTAERFSNVLAPKVTGGWNLREALATLETADGARPWMLSFSSGASLLGQPGQSSYACANAFLDALAQSQDDRVNCRSINWGPWAGGGMATQLATVDRLRLERAGVRHMDPSDALNWLGEAMARPEPQLAIWSFDKTHLRQAAAVPSILRVLAPSVPTAPKGDRAWLDVAPAEREETLSRLVRQRVAAVLTLSDADDIAAGRPLQELGLDSLMAVELKNALADLTQTTLPATLLFDYPTVGALTGHLSQLLWSADSAAMKTVAHEARSAAWDEAIAIVGMACRFPGAVRNTDDYWQLLIDGVDGIEEIPQSRWNVDAYYDPNPDAPGKMTTRWGGFISDVDQFDAGFFGIAPREVEAMDPQQRLLLEASWEALEGAGMPPHTLVGSSTGVFVGICTNDYQSRMMSSAAIEGIDAYIGTGNAHSVASGRLSYVLGLQGPCMAVDTACSSSLVAVHLACQSLRSGECGMAVAAGVNLILSPEGSVYFTKLRATSPSGRCKTFDADADGYVRSEGCGVVVLKRLADAERDGDLVLAVLRGTAVNQDGRSQGLTAPNGLSQQSVIRAALNNAGVAPDAVGYVETHGTGTPLGDPIEVQALAEVYGSAEQPVVIGSVKSNVGHAEGAAGVASLIKAALVVQRDTIPPTLHVQQPNPNVEWSRLPVKIAREAQPWARERRICAVSSFGFSGTNAHMLVEAAPRIDDATPSAASTGPQLVLLSAKTAAGLVHQVSAWCVWLKRNQYVDIGDIAYTTCARRSQLSLRLAVVAANTGELLDALKSFLCNEPHPGLRTSDGPLAADGKRASKNAAGDLRDNAAMQNSLAEYLAGEDIHWQGPARQLVAAPAVPFDRERYWLEQVEQAPRAQKPQALHPLLGHRVESPAIGALQLFEQQLTQHQPAFLSDHVLDGQVLVPGVAYVDMAIAAARNINNVEALSLETVRFHTPLALTGDASLVQLAFEGDAFRVFAATAKAPQQWTLHAQGSLAESPKATPALALEALRQNLTTVEQSSELFYASLAKRGMQYGPSFRSVRELWQGSGEALGRVALPTTTKVDGHAVHPALLDACMHVLAAAMSDEVNDLMVPVAIARVRAHRSVPAEVWCHARLQHHDRGNIVGSVTLCDDHGHVLLVLEGIQFRSLRAANIERQHVVTRWQPLSSQAFAPTGRWLLLGKETPFTKQLTEQLRAAGATPVLLDVSDKDRWPDHFAQLAGAPVNGVLWLGGIDDERDKIIRSSLAWLRAAADAVGKLPPHWWLSERAVQIHDDEKLLHPWQHGLWGLGRALDAERPGCFGGIIDIDTRDESTIGALCYALSRDDNENQLAIRHGETYGLRLERSAASENEPWTPAPEGTALVTGGLGSIGRKLVHWLAKRGVARVVVTSRRGAAAPEAKALAAALANSATELSVVAADVCDALAMRDVFDAIEKSGRPLTAVFHAAGTLDDASLDQQDDERVARVLNAKAHGAFVLSTLLALTPECPLVLFSSIASALGSVGQLSYAAANAVLDGLAGYRRSRGLATTCINWGPWCVDGDGAGMAANLASGPLAEALHSLDSEVGLAALALAMAQNNAPPAIIADIDWAAFRPLFEAGRNLRMLDNLAPRLTDPALILKQRQFAGASEDERRDLLSAWLQERVGRTLGLRDGSSLNDEDDLFDLGIDSLMLLELRNGLALLTQQPIDVATLYEHGNIAALAQKLASANPGASTQLPSPLVALRTPEQPTASPLLLVHAGTGGIEIFTKLASHLDDSQPLLGARALGLMPNETPLTSFEKMAECYLDALTSVQPTGPYRLGGYSVGGVLAWEMARQLEERGAEVERLFLIDAWPHHRVRHSGDRRPGEELLIFAAAMGIDVAIDAVGEAEAWARLDKAIATGNLPFQRSDLERRRDVGDALATAWQSYHRTTPIQAPITLLRANRPKGIPGIAQATIAQLMKTPDYGWSDLSRGGVKVIELNADHFDIMAEPAAQQIARELSKNS